MDSEKAKYVDIQADWTIGNPEREDENVYSI